MALQPRDYGVQERLQPGARGEIFQANLPGYRDGSDRINRTNNYMNTSEHDVPNIKYQMDYRLPVLFKYGFAHGFNQIVLPLCKPGMATQAIFIFVSQWNNLFIPMILLTDKNKWTMPMMVSQLAGDMYKTEYGAVYLGLLLTVLPIFVIYFLLSKYIIAGVALGGVKE